MESSVKEKQSKVTAFKVLVKGEILLLVQPVALSHAFWKSECPPCLLAQEENLFVLTSLGLPCTKGLE